MLDTVRGIQEGIIKEANKVQERMQKLLQHIVKECRKIDILENPRIAVEVYDCDDAQYRVITKKNGQVLFAPIVLRTYKDSLGNTLYD